jgi:prepilin-type N-terminal cleavage/methylation domain-containing protein
MYTIERRKEIFGFTLIETLIVAAMLSVVALALYSTFSSGIKIWQKLTQKVLADDVNIFFEKISDDLRNSFRFSGISFVGREDSLNFATLVKTDFGQREKVFTVGKVDYTFDAQTKSLNRQQVSYSQLYQNTSVPLRQMIANVEALRFQYYRYNPEEELYVWEDFWQEEENIPLAVRITIYFGNAAKTESLAKTISIPLGG